MRVRSVGALIAALLGGVVLAACPKKRVDPAAPAASTSSSGPDEVASGVGSESSSGASTAKMPPVSWRGLVAAEAWGPALEQIGALSNEERGRLATRLAFVRAAVGRCTKVDGEGALAELKEVRDSGGDQVKALDRVLGDLEVDALVCAERWKDALAIGAPSGLASRGDAASYRTLAKALEATGDLPGARTALSRAIEGAPKAGLPLGALVGWRVKLDRAMKDDAALALDRKRLFVEIPASFEAAVKAGEPSDPPAMSIDDWLKRGDALAGLGRSDDALAAIDQAAKLGALARPIARAKGAALYKAKAYTKAAVALADAAKMGPPSGDGDSLYDAFHSARAKSRGGDDDTAIKEYDDLAKFNGKAHWGAEAGYLAAQLRFLHGNYKDAIDAYERFLASPASKLKGEEQNAREARRGRAMAFLASGDAVKAAKAFGELARGDDYDGDPFARARIELLGAISLQHTGAGAYVELKVDYAKMRDAWPYSFVDLGARKRLTEIAVPPAAWPTSTYVPPSVTLPSPVDLLERAGLVREARAAIRPLFKSFKDDEARCAALEEIDDGYDAYLVGVKQDVSLPPDASPWRWRCAYPVPYSEYVRALETRERLPPGLLHAILRQESAFRVEVVSFAGAVGIAQLMPATAASVAKDAGLPPIDEADVARLESPALQLDLCARHLRQLLDEFGASDGSPAKVARAIPLVIAGYNAGAAAVKRWLAEAPDLESEIFVERIPFLETRAYVVRVLGNVVRYSILSGNAPYELPAKF